MKPLSLPAAVAGFVIVLLISLSLTSGCAGLLTGRPGTSLRAGTTGDLKAYFLDVGQGDASVILFRDKVILIDAGEMETGGRVVADLQKLGVRKIDLLVATHPHSDHIGGMQEILRAFPVGRVLDSGVPASSPLYEHFLTAVDEKDIPYLVAGHGQTIDLDPLLQVLVLSAPGERIGDDLNAESIVLRISFGSISLLYEGDATTAAEEVMMKSGYPLDAQVLKAGHHGSSTSGSAAFLSRVRPELAVISLGADNPYGHPHRETLDRLAAAGASVYRTDLDGTVLVTSDGAGYSVVTEKDGGNIRIPAGSVPETAGIPGMSVSQPPSVTAVPPAPSALQVTLPAVTAAITLPVPALTVPPFPVGNASSVAITGAQFNAPGDDTRNLNGEWVRLTNRGNDPVLLTGWTLADRHSAQPYRFPAFLLLPERSVTIYTGSGVLNDTALFMGRTEPLWGNSGDTATLRDGRGTLIDWRSEEGMP